MRVWGDLNVKGFSYDALMSLEKWPRQPNSCKKNREEGPLNPNVGK